MRIAFAGISHEGLGTSPVGTRLEDFRVVRGQALLREGPDEIGRACQELEVEPVPILAATHLAPGGNIELGAYLQLRDEIVGGLARAGNLDGVCLLLHGAMQVEHLWSGDTDLVREIRAALGRDVLLCARLDLHANLEDDFANRADIWTAFRTAPHRDAVETTHRALRLLVSAVRSGTRPQPVFIPLPLLLPGEKATTHVEPMRSLEAMAREIEQEPGMLNAEVCVGFGWADSPSAGSSVTVIAQSVEHLPQARRHATRLAQAMWDRRWDFAFDQEVAGSVDAALDTALAAAEPSVWLTDSGDNPTAGTPGDSTYFLARMLERQIADAVFASIPDESAWRVCEGSGVGATVELELGAKWDNTRAGPLRVRGVVEHLFDGDLARKISPMATVNVNGVQVIVTCLRKYITTLGDFRNAGIEPLMHRIVVVKLGYLMPELRDAAPREILVLTPGYSDMQLDRLPYRYVRRPIFPLDGDFAWRPRIGNAAGYTD